MKLPIWEKLPSLPLEFGIPMILHMIGNKIGKFIKVDEKTLAMEKLEMVNICVEMIMNKGLPKGISLNYGGSS